jgi:hypothetical protein
MILFWQETFGYLFSVSEQGKVAGMEAIESLSPDSE